MDRPTQKQYDFLQESCTKAIFEIGRIQTKLEAAESRAEQAEAELATHKRALELACEYISETDCPGDLSNLKVTCDKDACDECASICWSKHFLAQAERGSE